MLAQDVYGCLYSSQCQLHCHRPCSRGSQHFYERFGYHVEQHCCRFFWYFINYRIERFHKRLYEHFLDHKHIHAGFAVKRSTIGGSPCISDLPNQQWFNLHCFQWSQLFDRMWDRPCWRRHVFDERSKLFWLYRSVCIGQGMLGCLFIWLCLLPETSCRCSNLERRDHGCQVCCK